MQFIPLIFAGAGMLAGAAGAKQQAQAQEAQFKAAAAADQYNAAVKRERSQAVTKVYGQREEQQRRNAKLLAGKRAAAMGQSGIGISSFDATEHQSAVFAELDALNIRYEGALEAKGLLDSATLDDFYGANNLSNASNAKKAGRIAVASALLSGGSKMYGAYQSMEKG